MDRRTGVTSGHITPGFLNIVGSGMKGGPVEQNLADMDAKLTAMRAAEFPEVIVGVKVAHYAGDEWDHVDRAVAAGEAAGLPVAVDFGGHVPPLSLEDLFMTHLRPGDIFTHTYTNVRDPYTCSVTMRPKLPG